MERDPPVQVDQRAHVRGKVRGAVLCPSAGVMMGPRRGCRGSQTATGRPGVPRWALRGHWLPGRSGAEPLPKGGSVYLSHLLTDVLHCV